MRWQIGLALALTLSWVASLLAQRSAGSRPAGPFAALDRYVPAALAAWDVPGAAIAIVRNDSIVYIKGFGVRELGLPAPVDSATLFAIGSNTKAFTATAAAMLVTDGRMAWDTPLTAYLPGFAVADPYATRQITLRDALAHRTGLARYESVWYGTGFSREDLLARLRYAEMEGGLRSGFGYNNLAYLAAGAAIGAAAGSSWDAVIAERILTPLGMASTSPVGAPLEQPGNVAAPHQRIGPTVRKVPVRNIDNVAPAGAIVSNVLDMAQWLRFQLANGSYRGQRLVSEDALRATRSAQVVMGGPVPGEPYQPLISAYGLGWVVSEYAGQSLVWHNGGIDGFMAEVRLLPGQNAGWVLLTNSYGTNLMPAISYRIADLLLGRPARDWSAEMLAAQRARPVRAPQEANMVTGAVPLLPLERYAGRYTDPLFGEVTVELRGDRLRLGYGPNFSGPLDHSLIHTFRVSWEGETAVTLPGASVTFGVDAAARPIDVTISGLTTFRRVRP